LSSQVIAIYHKQIKVLPSLDINVVILTSAAMYNLKLY